MTITAPDGAYIIGGGEYHFGQAITEDLARAAFEFPMPTLGNMIELLRSVLEMLPLDALKPFKGFLGLDDAHFGTVVDAVNGIISSLQQRPVFMLLTDFTSWVKDLVQAITGVAGGGDLSMLTTWFKSNVIDQIANIGTQIQNVVNSIVNFVTTSDLAAAISNFVTNSQLLNAIKDFVTSIDLAAAIKNAISEIVKVFTGTAGVLSDLSSWVASVLNPVLSGFQKLLDAIFSLFGGTAGTGKTVADAIAAITGWLNNTFKGVSDGLAAIVKTVNDLIAGFFELFGGTGTANLTAMLAAATNWMTVTFKNVSDGLAAIVKTVTDLINGLSGVVGGTVAQAVKVITDVVKTVTDLINGLFSLFGGTGTINLTTMLAAATAWMTNWQKFVDGIWSAFSGGVAGVGKTVADALAAVTGWFGGVFQKLIDGINALASLIPGFSAGSNPIQNAVDIISGILGIGQSAAASAAQANMGVSAILAAQAGGFSDEFDYPLATELPTAEWKKQVSLLDSYGPDGNGVAAFNPSGIGAGELIYTQVSKPLTGPDMKVTAVLSRLPRWDLITKSGWFLCVQTNLTDKSCYRVEILNTQCQFEKVDAAGNHTDIGGKKTIPANALGIPYSLEIKGNTLTLTRNGIVAATQTVTAPLSGRHVGFGAYKTTYVGAEPCAEFAGVAWQPV